MIAHVHASRAIVLQKSRQDPRNAAMIRFFGVNIQDVLSNWKFFHSHLLGFARLPDYCR